MSDPTTDLQAALHDLRVSARIEDGGGFCAVRRTDVRLVLSDHAALMARVAALTEALETIGALKETTATGMSDPVIRGWAYAAARVARDALALAKDA